MNKPELQELALQQDIEIYHPDGHEKAGKELTVDELKEAIEAKKAELQAEADAADAARASANEADDGDDGDDGDDSNGDDGDSPENDGDSQFGDSDDLTEEEKAEALREAKAKKVAKANAAMQADATKTRRARAEAKARASHVADPDPVLLEKLGIKGPSAADRKLAEKHGYPVAVPKGKAFRTRVGFNCSFGGGYRDIDTVVILAPHEVEHKREFVDAI